MLVGPGRALEQAKPLARRVIVNAPLAFAASKLVIVQHRDWPIADTFTRQESITGHLPKVANARAGWCAFAERRAPVWTGK